MSQSPAGQPIPYRRDIDGLRAVAVVTVILFHAGVPWLEGGFLGVDIFFVISGFLIYSIILKRTEGSGFSFAEFYERRARRIAPALILVILATIPFAWVLFDPLQLQDFGQSVACATLFCANVLFWSEADYFAHAAELKPLLHTWSLSVEEQFYLVFPFLAILVSRVGDGVKAALLVGLLLLSLGTAVLFREADPSAAFYLLHTRAWELLAGALCAVAVRHVRKARPALSDLGLLLIVASVLLVDDGMGIPGLVCVPAVLGACLVMVYGSNGGASGRLLSSGPFVFIGLLSYSAYLFHQPLLAYVRLVFAPETWVLVSVGLLALPLGYLSWRFVERPFRDVRPDGGFLLSRPALLGAISVPVLLFVGFGGTMHVMNGVPERKAPNGQTWAALDVGEKLAPNYGLDRTCSVNRERSIEDVLSAPACRTSPTPQILLWGDSFAMHLAQVLAESDPIRQKGLQQVTLSQCAPVLGFAEGGSITSAADCLAFNEAVMARIESDPAITHVVLSSPFFIGPRIDQGHSVASSDAAEALRLTLERISAAGVRPILVGPTPGNATNLGRCLSGNYARDVPLSRCDVPEADIDPRVTSAYALLTEAAQGDTPIIDLRAALCRDGRCKVSDDDVFLYRDWGHFSNEGARWLGRSHALFDAALSTPAD